MCTKFVRKTYFNFKLSSVYNFNLSNVNEDIEQILVISTIFICHLKMLECEHGKLTVLENNSSPFFHINFKNQNSTINNMLN